MMLFDERFYDDAEEVAEMSEEEARAALDMMSEPAQSGILDANDTVNSNG